MITPVQCRVARALLNWTGHALCEKASVCLSTIRNFERGASTPMVNNHRAIQTALERGGVRFTERGVELADPEQP